MQYWQDIATQSPITRMELITISISIGTTLQPIFCVLENLCRKFANLVAPSTDGTTKHLVHIAKQRPNPCIIGNAILPQFGEKMTKKAVLNLALYCGAI